MNVINDVQKTIKERTVYIILSVIAVVILTIAIVSRELTIEILAAKIVNLAIAGGALYAIRKWDFAGVNFTEAIKQGNISAAISLAGLMIMIAILVSSIG